MMKLTTEERAKIAGMMAWTDEKLKTFPPYAKMKPHQRRLVDGLCDARLSLRKVLEEAEA